MSLNYFWKENLAKIEYKYRIDSLELKDGRNIHQTAEGSTKYWLLGTKTQMEDKPFWVLFVE